MGVLHGRDLLSSKYITAEIKDASGRLHFVPIKYTLGNYFVAQIDNDAYVFELDHTEIGTWAESFTKTFRKVNYDITHYRPISRDVKELEIVLKTNSLPRVNGTMFNVFKVLSAKEKNEFEPHVLKELVDEVANYEKKSKIAKAISKQENQFLEQKKNIINYLESLNTDQIVTPLRNITEFIEDDLKATDPKFLGTILSTYQRTDFENKKVTNVPIKAKQGWMKIIALVSIIGLIAALGYIVYDSGALNNLGAGIGGSFGGMSDKDIMAKYPSEAALRDAVDSGKLKYDSLSPAVKKMYDNSKAPKIAPKT